ncbi:MAG: hypothetical protein RBQ97_05475 [Acholeplasma sp.]|nr:hypothetical protein [Acholeplasma sp.]
MKKNLKRIIFTSILAALGITIPLFMPKIVIGDASYTLASHVPLFIAAFIGLDVTILVGMATGAGFFLALTPIIAARAFSHLLWAIPLTLFLRKFPKYQENIKYSVLLNIFIAFFHALFEVIVVLPFYGTKISDLNWILTTLLLPIGLGGFVHSLVDFQISFLIFGRIKDALINANIIVDMVE